MAAIDSCEDDLGGDNDLTVFDGATNLAVSADGREGLVGAALRVKFRVSSLNASTASTLSSRRDE